MTLLSLPSFSAEWRCWNALLSIPSKIKAHRATQRRIDNLQTEEILSYQEFTRLLRKKGTKDAEEILYPLRLEELGHNWFLLTKTPQGPELENIKLIRKFLNWRIEKVFLEWAKRDLDLFSAEARWVKAVAALYEGEEMPTYSHARDRSIRELNTIEAERLRELQRYTEQKLSVDEAQKEFEDSLRESTLDKNIFNIAMNFPFYKEFTETFTKARDEIQQIKEASDTGPFM